MDPWEYTGDDLPLSDLSEDRYSSQPEATQDGTDIASEHETDEDAVFDDYEKPDSPDELRTLIKNVLEPMSRWGTFLASGLAPDLPNPLLDVQDVGTIGLPISERDIATIRTSIVSEFADGTSSTSPTNVPASRLSFRNEAWTDAVGVLARGALQDLKFWKSESATLTFRSLTISTGGPVAEEPRPQNDDRARCVVRLAIHLPCQRAGGAIFAGFAEESFAAVDDAMTAELTSSWTACLPDADLVTDTIDTGYRCTLNYDVETAFDNHAHTTASMQDVENRLKCVLIDEWPKEEDDQTRVQAPKLFVYPVGKSEGDDTPTLESMPPRMREHLRLLSRACSETDVEVLYGLLDRKLEYSAHTSEPFSELSLNNVRTMMGDSVALCLPIHRNGLVLPEVYRTKADRKVKGHPNAEHDGRLYGPYCTKH